MSPAERNAVTKQTQQFFTSWLYSSREQAIQHLDAFRTSQREAMAAKTQAVTGDIPQFPDKPFTPVVGVTTQLPANGFTVAINPKREPQNPQPPVQSGLDAEITACLDSGGGTFTQVTLTFQNGILTSIA